MAEGPKKKTNVVVWAVLGLLVFALGGFGIGNFGGTVRAIGAVGDAEISVNDYALALQTQLRARQAQTGQAISLAAPEGQALAQSVRRQLISSAALENETARLGLSVGDARVRAEVLATPAFQGLDGKFDREAYAFTLRQNGLSEAEFEENIRTEAASNLTAAAVLAGIAAPATHVGAIAAYAGERRDILWLRLDAGALAEPLPAPTEAELQAEYEANPAAYTEPEKKRLTYVALTPEMMAGEIAVEEAELLALYEARAEEFNRPERRLVERLVFPDTAAAEAAKTALDGGDTSFEALVAERGLALADIDLGDVTEAELGAAGALVFALAGPGVAGPVDTALGPALFRVNAVLAAESTGFEEVRDQLTDELTLDRARREIGDLREGIDDLLAGGATLEEVAAETPMELGTIELAPDTADGIAAYAAFREAAAAVTAEDFPELIELEDGGLVALRLDALLPPALLPLEDVRDRVAADWEAAETEARLLDLSEEIRAAREGGQSFLAQGYVAEARQDLGRESFLDGAPANLIEAAFGLEPGETAAVAEGGTVHIIELTRITPEDPEAEDAVALRAQLEQGLARGLSQDALDLFLRALQAEAGITLNQSAINAVHAQFP
jgi:peptidyl-prolyl cis-trans isomerase D